MKTEQTYRTLYLRFLQICSVNHSKMKNMLKAAFQSRINTALKAWLHNINKTTANNAISISAYSFGTVKWLVTELARMIHVMTQYCVLCLTAGPHYVDSTSRTQCNQHRGYIMPLKFPGNLRQYLYNKGRENWYRVSTITAK